MSLSVCIYIYDILMIYIIILGLKNEGGAKFEIQQVARADDCNLIYKGYNDNRSNFRRKCQFALRWAIS